MVCISKKGEVNKQNLGFRVRWSDMSEKKFSNTQGFMHYLPMNKDNWGSFTSPIMGNGVEGFCEWWSFIIFIWIGGWSIMQWWKSAKTYATWSHGHSGPAAAKKPQLQQSFVLGHVLAGDGDPVISSESHGEATGKPWGSHGETREAMGKQRTYRTCIQFNGFP